MSSAKLVPDGPRLRERPTLILLHGGPGMDHSSFKSPFSRFTDITSACSKTAGRPAEAPAWST
jgi:predicted PilT family ATPase